MNELLVHQYLPGEYMVSFSWVNTKKNGWLIEYAYVSHFKKLPDCFPSGYTTLYSLQLCMRVLIFPHPPQHLVWSVFLNFSHSSR